MHSAWFIQHCQYDRSYAKHTFFKIPEFIIQEAQVYSQEILNSQHVLCQKV